MLRQPMMFSKGGLSAADVDARIAAATVNPFPYLETFDPFDAADSSGMTANDIRMARLPILAKALTVNTVSIWVNSANGNVDIAVFTSADGSTFTRQQSTGSTATAGSAAVQNITFAFTFQAGVQYWAGIVADGTATMLRDTTLAGGIGAIDNLAISKTAVGIPIPASVSGLSGNAGRFWMRFRTV